MNNKDQMQAPGKIKQRIQWIKVLPEVDDILKHEQNSFSNPGIDKFGKRVSDYARDLFAESKRVSKKYKSDMISSTHVEIAAGNLIKTSKSKRIKLLGVLGGILLGISLSNVVTITPTVSYQYLVITVFCAILGSVFLLVDYYDR